MLLSRLRQLSGIALLISALLSELVSIAGVIFFPITGLVVPLQEIQHPLWVPLWSVYFFGIVLLVVGLPAMYLHQATRAGIFGLVSFLITLISNYFTLAILCFYIVFLPFLAIEAPHTLKDTFTPSLFIFSLGAGGLSFIGLIAFGIATIRSKVFPAFTGILLIGGGLLSLTTVGTTLLLTILGMISTTLTSLGFGWIGYCLIVQAPVTTTPMQKIAASITSS